MSYALLIQNTNLRIFVFNVTKLDTAFLFRTQMPRLGISPSNKAGVMLCSFNDLHSRQN